MNLPKNQEGVLSEKVNIRVYPEKISGFSDNIITFGDMHGNTMKLIWSLMREGVIEVSCGRTPKSAQSELLLL